MEHRFLVPAQDGTSQSDLSVPGSAQISSENTPSELTNQINQQLVNEKIAGASQALLASNSPSERIAAARELGVLGDQSAVTKIESQQRFELEQQLKSEIDSLRKAEAEQVKRIAAVAHEVQERKEQETKLVANLERLTLELQRRAETERQLKEEVERLRKEELDQFQRIEQLGAQLREIQETSRQKYEGTELRLQALAQKAEIETRARVEAALRVAELEAKLREFELKAREQEQAPVEFEQFHSYVEVQDPEIVSADSFEFSESRVQSLSIISPESDEDDSFIIVDFEQDNAFVIVEEYSANQFESNSLSIEVVREEQGIELAGEESSIPKFLLERLRSEDPAERGAALFDLTQFAGDQAFSLIAKAFDDQVADVRHAAARALFELDRDRVASFTQVLREASVERRRKIGAAMGGSGIAADAIDSLVGESRGKIYDAFSILFLMAKAGEIQPLVCSIETHSDLNVRLAVISLLTFSNQPEIIPAFRRLAVRATLPAEIRSALMEAIHQISTQNPQAIQSVA